MTDIPVQCYVYKGKNKADTYLWLPEEGGFDAVPEALLEKLGPLEAVMDFDLYPGKKLARAVAEEVIAAFGTPGFYLQLPPRDSLQAAPLPGYGESSKPV